MKSINPSCRRFLSLSFVASLALTLVMLVSGCIRLGRSERRGSDTPLTLEQFNDPYLMLSIPRTATDIRYKLSGWTRDWGSGAFELENREVYLSYKITPSDLKEHIGEITHFSETKGASEGAHFERRPINSDTLTWRSWRRAPRWWKPLDIKKGYFVRYSYDDYEIRAWVNEDDNTVLVYEHEK